jgi:hypothetical protein
MKKASKIFFVFAVSSMNIAGYNQTTLTSTADTISTSDFLAMEAAVSPLNMNVLYRGLDNPIAISAPCSNDPIIVACEGCTIRGNAGKYTVRPENLKQVTITLSQIKEGKQNVIGVFKFRVKPVPIPTITWTNRQSGDSVTAKNAAIAPLIPMMADFDYDVYSVITGYDIRYTYKNLMGGKTGVIGNNIPTDIAKEIKDLPSGTQIYFENIKVVVPGGEQRTSSAFFIIK